MTDTTLRNVERTPGATAGRSSALGAVAVVITIVVLAAWLFVSRTSDDLTPLQRMSEIDQTAFVAETGVEIDHAALIGGGGLIEIRYRIVNVERSEIVHSVEFPPRIVHDDFELAIPRHEHSHDRENRIGASYNEQVINYGGIAARGDLITVVIGTTALEGVPLQ